MGRDGWESPEDQAIRRKNRIRLAIVAPVAILIVVVAVVAYMRNPEEGGSSAPPVPAAFLGEWRGVADNGRGTVDVVLAIGGENAEQAVTSSQTDTASGARCDRSEQVVAATETELTLSARSTGAAGCEDAQSTVQLHSDGSLAYRSSASGGSVTGTLHRS